MKIKIFSIICLFCVFSSVSADLVAPRCGSCGPDTVGIGDVIQEMLVISIGVQSIAEQKINPLALYMFLNFIVIFFLARARNKQKSKELTVEETGERKK